jgi:anti-sigma factor RsiW
VRCEEFVELVTAFLDGALDAETEARFVEHIAGCDGCETYLHQFRQTVAALGALPAGMSSDDQLSADARATLSNAFRDWRP